MIFSTLVTIVVTLAIFYYRDVVKAQAHPNKHGCVPYNLIQENEKDSIKIMWETQDDCISYVKYGVDASELKMMTSDPRGVKRRKDHEVHVNGLRHGEPYYFILFSDEKPYGQNGAPLIITTDPLW